MFLIKFWRFLVLCLGCECMTFDFMTQVTSITPYPCWWIKSLNSKTAKYIPKCWERSVKRKPKLNFISHKKVIFWSKFSISDIYVPNLSKFFLTISCSPLRTSPHQQCNNVTSLTLIEIAFFWEVSHIWTGLSSSLIKFLKCFCS